MSYQEPIDLLRAIVDRHSGIFAVLHEAVLLGWEAAIREMASLSYNPAPLRLRARRNIENEYAIGYARRFLEPQETAGILTWVDEADTLTLRLDPSYAVRVKKVDSKGRTSNIKTHRQRRIAETGQLLLFGISEEDMLCDDQIWLTVGYVPDSLDEKIEIVGLTIGDGRIGLHALDRAEDDALALLAPASWPLIEEARRQILG